ncbi:MAG: hypothetical protein H7061_00730 [Bdellovibrionaceae bacterium]|nr:hypothetical protein [Bdellovibrio sp.]
MKLHVKSNRTYVVLAASLMFLMAMGSSRIGAMNGSPNTLAAINSPLSTTKSYREWKQYMVADAELRLRVTKDAMIGKSKAAPANTIDSVLNNELKNLQNQFDKEKLQLSMTHDLTISDYFVGYLTKQKHLANAIKEVSGRLSAEEVAELMGAYANNFFSSTPRITKQAPQAEVRNRQNP